MHPVLHTLRSRTLCNAAINPPTTLHHPPPRLHGLGVPHGATGTSHTGYIEAKERPRLKPTAPARRWIASPRGCGNWADAAWLCATKPTKAPSSSSPKGPPLLPLSSCSPPSTSLALGPFTWRRPALVGRSGRTAVAELESSGRWDWRDWAQPPSTGVLLVPRRRFM